MKHTKLVAIAALAGGAMLALSALPDYEPENPFRDSVTEQKLGPGNKPVYMAGCQTHNPPVAPKAIYPTVNTNFLARLCALEVPPPEDAVMLGRAHPESSIFLK